MAHHGAALRGQHDTTYVIEATTGRADGDGLAVTYRARIAGSGQIVALRVLRDDTAVQVVFDRVRVAEELYAAQVAQGKVPCVPRLIEGSPSSSPPFLAFEPVPGEPLDALLTPGGLPGVGGEHDAITILAQLADMYDLLHTSLHRGCPALSLRGLFWDAQKRRVALVDFGGFTEQGQAARPVDDLAALGKLFYGLLTGKEASLGEAEWPLAQRAGSRWGELSLWARRLCLQLLHPNLGRRFPSAHALAASVEELDERWSWTSAALASESGAYLRAGCSEADVAHAEALLDLARRKGDIAPNVLEKVESRLVQSGYASAHNPLALGFLSFNVGNYDEALRRWRDLAEGSGQPDHYRWAIVANAGRRQPQAVGAAATRIREAVELLAAGDYAAANRVLQQIVRDQPALAGPFAPFLAEVQAAQLEPRLRELQADAELHEKTNPVMAAVRFEQAADIARKLVAAQRTTPGANPSGGDPALLQLPDQLDERASRARDAARAQVEAAKTRKLSEAEITSGPTLADPPKADETAPGSGATTLPPALPQPERTRRGAGPFVLVAVGLVALGALACIGLRFFPGAVATLPSASADTSSPTATIDSGLDATPGAVSPSATIMATTPAAATPTSLPDPSQTPVITSMPAPTPPASVATIAIESGPFAAKQLFDLPPRIGGKTLPNAEVQISVVGEGGTPLNVSVRSGASGTWTWRPSDQDPPLRAGTYTIGASAIDPASQQEIRAESVQFVIIAPPTVQTAKGTQTYTQPNDKVSYVDFVSAGTTLDVVAVTSANGQDWYQVRTQQHRRLGWLLASLVQTPLSEDARQRLPRSP